MSTSEGTGMSGATVGSGLHQPRGRASLPTNGLGLCTATTADGRPCPVKAMHGSNPPRCYQHNEDPKVAEHRALARRLGGLNATMQRFLSSDTPSPVLDHPQGVRQILQDTIQQVRTGQLAPNVANTIIYGVSVALKLAELELSARVARLEQRLIEVRS